MNRDLCADDVMSMGHSEVLDTKTVKWKFKLNVVMKQTSN